MLAQDTYWNSWKKKDNAIFRGKKTLEYKAQRAKEKFERKTKSQSKHTYKGSSIDCQTSDQLPLGQRKSKLDCEQQKERKKPVCKTCGKPRKGHNRNECHKEKHINEAESNQTESQGGNIEEEIVELSILSLAMPSTREKRRQPSANKLGCKKQKK